MIHFSWLGLLAVGVRTHHVIGKQLLKVFVSKMEHICTHFYILPKTKSVTTYVASSRDFNIFFQSSSMEHFDISSVLLSDFDPEDEPRKEVFMA